MNNEKSNPNYFSLIYVTVFSFAIAGCATQEKSTAFGIGAGAILGGVADPGKHGEYRTRNVVVGAALGGIAGTIAGAEIQENTEKQKQEAFSEGQSSAPKKAQGDMPGLKNPKVEARWIEARTTGNRYIEGHWEYLITQPARWEDGQ